jgi:hypothetical protein
MIIINNCFPNTFQHELLAESYFTNFEIPLLSLSQIKYSEVTSTSSLGGGGKFGIIGNRNFTLKENAGTTSSLQPT